MFWNAFWNVFETASATSSCTAVTDSDVLVPGPPTVTWTMALEILWAMSPFVAVDTWLLSAIACAPTWLQKERLR